MSEDKNAPEEITEECLENVEGGAAFQVTPVETMQVTPMQVTPIRGAQVVPAGQVVPIDFGRAEAQVIPVGQVTPVKTRR